MQFDWGQVQPNDCVGESVAKVRMAPWAVVEDFDVLIERHFRVPEPQEDCDVVNRLAGFLLEIAKKIAEGDFLLTADGPPACMQSLVS